jgi:ribonuclease P protein component
MRFKRFKLRRRKDIQRVFTEGKSISNENFSIKILVKKTENEKGAKKNTDEKNEFKIDFRFTVIVPKKAVKLAVRRNRIKRIVREAVRSLIKENKVFDGDMVIIVKKDISFLKSYSVKAEIEKILRKYMNNEIQ